jgi:hypothetical protein
MEHVVLGDPKLDKTFPLRGLHPDGELLAYQQGTAMPPSIKALEGIQMFLRDYRQKVPRGKQFGEFQSALISCAP